MSQCKCKEVECEECPEWIFTLADLIMCMMGLFVILWCLKPGADQKINEKESPDLIKVLAAIREAFGHIPDPSSTDPVDIFILSKKLQELPPMKGPGQGGKTEVHPDAASGSANTVTSIRPGNYAIVGSRVLFEPGQYAISPDGTRILNEIVDLIKGHRNIFMVKGHASLDDFGESGNPQQRMDLSLKRAQIVADYLVAHGMDADTIRVIGCSTFEPIIERVPTAEQRKPNRRVEVQSLDQLVEEYKDVNQEPAKPLDNAHKTPDAKTPTTAKAPEEAKH